MVFSTTAISSVRSIAPKALTRARFFSSVSICQSESKKVKSSRSETTQTTFAEYRKSAQQYGPLTKAKLQKPVSVTETLTSSSAFREAARRNDYNRELNPF